MAPSYHDFTGARVGTATVLARIPGRDRSGKIRWALRCDCGKVFRARSTEMALGRPQSCGCARTIDVPPGTRSGRIVVTGRVGKWVSTVCDCGTIGVRTAEHFRDAQRRGAVQSCGCAQGDMLRQRQFRDLQGQRFGALLAIESVGADKHGQYRWRCRCECGAEKLVLGHHLRHGWTTACAGRVCRANPMARVAPTPAPTSP